MDLHRFRRYLAALPGDAAPGLSWASLAGWAESHHDRFAAAVAALEVPALPPGAVDAIPLEPPPPGEDYERWGEAKRRRANLNALVALRQQQARSGPPDLAERRAMEAYTGWGGFRDIGDLPADSRIFPPLYVQGIKAWQRAQEKQALPTGPGADLFRGLRQQYFTSLPVAEGMWRLGCRAVPFPVRDALEPSAGVGRLLRVAQDTAVRWTAVEMDPLLAEFLRALFPEVDVREMPFETFAREASKGMAPGAGWDLVVANPPFPERPGADRALDPKFDGWKNADAYFAVRSSTLLRAGGTLVFLTPMANIVGASGTELRAALMRRCHFAGAIFPPQNIFPNISTQLVMHVWTRRAADRTEFTPHEQLIINGGYLELPEGQANTLGTWVKRSGPHGEVDVVEGTFDPRSLDYAQLYPLSSEELEQIRTARGVQSAAPVPQVKKSGPKVTPAEALPLILTEARALTERLQEFTRRLGHGGADAAIAEAGREELKVDLLDFYARHGAPGLLRELRADRKRYAPLLAAVGDDGTLSDAVAIPRGLSVLDAPPPDATPRVVVEFFSRQNGVCSDFDLSNYFTYDVTAELLADPEVAVELREDGTRWWYRLAEYTTGDLYARLALLEGMLADTEPGWQTKLEDQRAVLLAALREKDLSDLDVTPRSGFVSPECLTAWVVDTIYQSEVSRAEIAAADSALRKKDPYRGVPTNVVRRPIVVLIENGRLELTGVPENLDDQDIRWLAFLAAFWNRSLRVEDPTGGGTRMDAFKRDQATPEERMAAEDQLVTQFKSWLSQSEWGPRVVQAYNRAYSGFRLREYDSGALAIARLGPHPRGYELHAYQNASVRRLVDRGSGALALDVGLGKTATLLASIAAMRQAGKARRALVVVPNSVLGKWAKEAKEWLPTYRIGVIGISMGRHGVRSDTPEERAEKWNRLAQGAYELCLCTQQNFLDDVALSDERTADLVSQMFWLQRDLGLSLAEKKLVQRKIEEAEEKIREIRLTAERFTDELKAYEEGKVPHRWNVRANYSANVGWVARETQEKLAETAKKIEAIQASIAKWREQLAEPTSTEIEKARQVAEGFLTERPFRPLKDRPLVDWTSLGVDLLGVDEAHAYKNIWKPSNRYGKSIKYMGGMEQKASKGKGRKGDEEEDDSPEEEESFGKTRGRRTIRAWDMFLKTQDLLDRQEDRGVILLTATPVTNSPMEVYNLLSLVSRRVWLSRQVRSKEEFVDRYCRFSEQLIADGITGDVRYQLAMTEFVGLDELRGIMSAYIEYRTTQDVLAWQEKAGIPPERRLRVPTDVPHQETLPVDPVQADVYQRLRALVIAEQIRLREAKAPPKEISALNLVLSDLLSKAALDPRLLIEDLKEIQRQIPKTKDPAAEARLARRAAILTESGAAEASLAYQRSGAVPEKYLALARNVAARPGAGHIVFCLAGETEVLTAGGVKPIRSLAGTTQTILTREGAWVEAPIRSFGHQPLCEVMVSRNGIEHTIRATKEHRWFARPTASRHKGDGWREMTTSELFPGVRLQQVFGRSYKNRVHASPFGVAHGFVVGDGSSPKNERHCSHADLHGEKDAALAPYFALCPRQDFPDIAQGFVRFTALPNYFKQLPSIHENLSYLLGWLMGYFAADGTVTSAGQCRITSTRRENLEFVRDACAVLGIGTYNIAPMDPGRTSYPNAAVSYRIDLIRHTLDESFFLVDAHREKYIAAGSDAVGVREWRVIGVRDTDSVEEVFCASVPESRSFVLAGNIATGNCDYKMAHEEIIRVLTTYAGIPRSRIVTLTGDDDKADRLEIASGLLVRNADGSIKSNTGGFNGRDPIVQGEGTPEEVVFDPGADPAYDVIIGTSGAMSEGIDLQRRTAAVHHLNYSWVPSVIQQRNGRAVRQGNRFGLVNLWYYLSERTIDVVRLSVTWGKGNWLGSLFGEAQSIANPAASIGSDVEEAIAEMFAPDPEAARLELQRVRAEREAEQTKKQRERAQARWISLVSQYEQARGVRDPMAQAVKMEMADQAANALRSLPRTIFPQAGLLAQARRERVFYDLASGIHFAVGGRFRLRLYGIPKFEPVEGVIEIVDFRVTMGRDSIAMWFAFRSYGHLETHYATTLRGLLAPRMKELGRTYRGEGGTLEQLPASWSMEQELKELKVYADSLRQLPKSLLPVGDAVWAAYVATGWGGSGRQWIPLRTHRAPGEVWLYPTGLLRDLRESGLWKDFVPLYGADDRSWRLLCEAIRNNRVRTYFVTNKNYGNINGKPEYEEKFRPFDMDSKPTDGWSDRGQLAEMARLWFGRVPPEPLFVEGQRHEPPGPVKASTGVPF